MRMISKPLIVAAMRLSWQNHEVIGGQVMKTKWKRIGLLAAVLVLAVSACAHQPAARGADLPGFWLGLWHGLTMGFALIGHLINESIRVYAYPNNGGWYDFGYFIGAGGFGGGLSGAISGAIAAR
jgi:hypothetical protein